MSSSDATSLVKEFAHCRACGSGDLVEELNLGSHAVSDFYDKIPEDELKAPLVLMRCPVCSLVQLSHSVDKKRLYRHYWYRSGLNETMVAALCDIAVDAMSHVELPFLGSVLDIGSNDGTLLDQYPNFLKKYGVEPSDINSEDRHEIYKGFYPKMRPLWSATGKPRIITSIAMFYDLDDPNAFVSAIKEDLHKDGVWICQMMDLEGMLVANAFDNICHEHVAYWSIPAFISFVERHGLTVTKITRNNVNGGSVRFHVRHAKAAKVWYPSGAETQEIRAFARNVEEARAKMMAFLEECRQDGKLVLGYGASTKGNTLLQYYNITRELLPAIAERNLEKIDKVTAGQYIPIISEDNMRALHPSYLLILPWAFLDNFLMREGKLRTMGTRFIVPLPEFRIV